MLHFIAKPSLQQPFTTMTMSQFQPSIIVIKADCSGMEKNQQSIIYQARCFRVMQLKILKELLFMWEIAAACG